MYKLYFECKDPIMVKVYEHRFRAQFTKDAELMGTGPDVRVYWTEVMVAWAKLQEHYDYTLLNGARHRLYDANSLDPVLLVPRIRVREFNSNLLFF